MATRVITDSTSYLPSDLREGLGIAVVSLAVNFSDGTYLEEDVDSSWFYAKMVSSGEIPTSSQPAVSSLVETISAAVAAGDEVVAVLLSSRMSGTYDTALMARDMVLRDYPDARVEVVDSLSNCMQLGMAVLAAARAAGEGASATQAAEAARHAMARTRFLFVPHTLDYLKKGGRIGGASALLGTLLQIRPILTVVDGVTDVFGKVRTKKRALAEIVAAFEHDISAFGLADVFVHHIDDEREGRMLAELVEPLVGHPVPIVPIGPVIGLHVGPATVGLVYQTEKELTL